jgi:hypothetical protein
MMCLMLVFFAISATMIFQLGICLFCYLKQGKHA